MCMLSSGNIPGIFATSTLTYVHAQQWEHPRDIRHVYVDLTTHCVDLITHCIDLITHYVAGIVLQLRMGLACDTGRTLSIEAGQAHSYNQDSCLHVHAETAADYVAWMTFASNTGTYS